MTFVIVHNFLAACFFPRKLKKVDWRKGKCSADPGYVLRTRPGQFKMPVRQTDSTGSSAIKMDELPPNPESFQLYKHTKIVVLRNREKLQ